MNDSKLNIKLNFLYRDAGNYKLFGSVVFKNPKNISLDIIQSTIKQNLIDGEFFEPRKWKIPILTFPEYDDELDHDWNEIESIELTTEEATDERTISEFLSDLG